MFRSTSSILAIDQMLEPQIAARKEGVDTICDPKTQYENIEEVDHSVHFKDDDTRILLKLNVIFSCFTFK